MCVFMKCHVKDGICKCIICMRVCCCSRRVLVCATVCAGGGFPVWLNSESKSECVKCGVSGVWQCETNITLTGAVWGVNTYQHLSSFILSLSLPLLLPLSFYISSLTGCIQSTWPSLPVRTTTAILLLPSFSPYTE